MRLLVFAILLSACKSAPVPEATPAAAPAPAPVVKTEMCWLSTKEISKFDFREPKKYVKPPKIDGHEISAVGIQLNEKNEALTVGIWLEKDDDAFNVPVAPENRVDVTLQPIPLDHGGVNMLKIDSSKATRTSDSTWIWQGEILSSQPGRKPRHVFLFCSREL